MPSSLQTTFAYRVYYKDTDAGGVVYHSRYLEFMEMARTDYLTAMGISPYGLVKNHHIISPVIHLDIDYLKPAFYNDLLTVKINVLKITRLKIEFQYQIYQQDNTLLVQAKTINCFITKTSSDKLKPTRLPKDVLTKISKWSKS